MTSFATRSGPARSGFGELCRRLVRPAAPYLLAALLPVAPAFAQEPACLAEQEPNDAAEQATPVAGAFCMEGSISDADQEILAWTVDAESARRPWAISMEGPAGLQSRLQIHLLEEPGDGVDPAVVGPELMALVTAAGANAVERGDVFLTPGVWLVGLSVSAGEAGSYRVRFSPGEPQQPAAGAAQPAAASGAFETKGVLAQAESSLDWTLSGIDARRRWLLTATAPLGADVGLELQTRDGKPLLRPARLEEGRLQLPDIGLPAGTYRVRLTGQEGAALPFALSAVAQGPRSPGREEEPNDAPLTARPLALGEAMQGRFGQMGDIDTYLLPKTAAGQLLGIEVSGSTSSVVRLCIGGSEGDFLQCREGATPSLADILPGERARFVTLSGAPSPDGYQLTARLTGEAGPDGEKEPNDTAEQALPLGDAAVQGRFSGDDVDVFRFTAAGSELRRFTVSGEAVRSAEVVDGQNQSSARADRLTDMEGKPVPGPLELKDLALPPGDYFLTLSGADGAYTIAAETAAPAAVATGVSLEREPNDAVERAQLLEEGARVSGELTVTESGSDADNFRFSLPAQSSVALRLETDETCGVEFELSWESWSGAIPEANAKGEFVYGGLFEPGDYLVRLEPDLNCAGPKTPYTIGYEILPDTVAVGDVEPNDAFNLGRELPPVMKVSGTVGQFRDVDWFRLPPVEADTEVTVTVTGEVEVMLSDGKASSSFQMAQPTEIAFGNAGAPAVGTVPAGATAAVRVYGNGPYTLAVEMAGRTPAPSPPASAPGELSAGLVLEGSEIAAFWHRGQRLSGTLTLTNAGAAPLEAALAPAALPPGWRLDMPPAVTVAPGGPEAVPVSVEIEPDVYAARALRVAIAVQAGTAAAVSAHADVAATAVAPPVGDHLTFDLPEELRGGFNIAWTGLGGQLLPSDQYGEMETPEAVNDGLGSNAGFLADAAKLPVSFTVRFGGDRAWPVRGITINPQTPGVWPAEYIRDWELLLSADGQTFAPALKGRVGLVPREQSFLLPQGVEARAAQLRVLSNNDGNLGRVGFSEWKVIADPAVGIGVPLDIADSARGGHIVFSQPQISDQVAVIRGVLEAGDVGAVATVPEGQRPQFTIGFNENRAAQITSVEWTEAALDPEARHMPAVRVEASTETPLGPWTDLGELRPEGEGKAVLAFERPAWARFLRFTSTEAAGEGGAKVQFPTGLSVFERATDDTYRSILGEWGQYSPVSFYETTLPEAPARAEAAANETRETADALGFEETVSGRVEIGKDEDWYRLTQPDGTDLLEVTVGGEPSVGVDVQLHDASGKPVPLSEAGGSPRQSLFEARVEPGKEYYLQVVQPPHSVVIAYDTSGSLLAFIPIIFNALEVFAAGVTPGVEAVNFLPFDRTPLLRDFTDQPAVLKDVLARDARESTTSGLESTAMAAIRDLATRRGTRALLLVTDAATSTPGSQSDLWAMIAQLQPRIFAAHTGSFDDPLREKQLLQDLAAANGGHYVSSRSQAELDVAFDRVAAWLRRPAAYSLSVAARKAAPPEPGGLQVTAAAAPAVNSEAYAEPPPAAAVEIVLDASGSMLKRMEGRRRIEIARESLTKLVREELKRDAPVALRVFGNDRPGSCETSLLQPLGPLDPDYAVSLVDGIEPQNLAKTPIAASLAMVGEDLATASGRKTVILLTDGEETCGGDPRAAIAALAERDIEVRVNIVGFAVDDAALKDEFREWARIGRGRYFDATRPEDLDQAVKAAAELPFTVTDGSGAVVAEAVVGDTIELPAGSYRVEIAATPPLVFEGVLVREKEITRLEAGGV